MSEREVKPVWNKDSKFALNFNKFICWPLGIWPLDYNSKFSNCRLVFALFSQLWFISVQILPIYLHCGSSSDDVDYVMMATCAFMAFFKIATFRAYMNNIRMVFLSALDDWLSADNAEDRIIMKSFAKTGRFVFKLQIGFCYVSNTLAFTLPSLLPPMIMNKTLPNTGEAEEIIIVRQLPAKTGCLFGHYGDGIYGLYYVYECLMMSIAAHGNVGCDVVLFALLMHLCGRLEIIKKDLRSIVSTEKYSTDKRSQENIEKFIKKHAQILELAQAIEISASGMLVLQLFCNAGMNLMLGIRTMQALHDKFIFDCLRLSFAMTVLLLQLYLVSYASDRLCSQSESIVDALYESKWYELPPKLRKNLCFVAMRANKPVYLIAGRFYAVNKENFKNILKASFSYFSILRVMFDS